MAPTLDLFISHVKRLKHHVMFFLLTPTNPFGLTSEWPLWPPLFVFALQVRRELSGVEQQHVGVYIFTTYIVLTLFFHFPCSKYRHACGMYLSPSR